MEYKLIDGKERNKENPDTFSIPSPKEKAALKKGDTVKLGFELPDHSDGPGGERMWVKIVNISGDFYKGTLANSPVVINALSHGDVIEFKAKNILSVY